MFFEWLSLEEFCFLPRNKVFLGRKQKISTLETFGKLPVFVANSVLQKKLSQVLCEQSGIAERYMLSSKISYHFVF